MGSSGLTTLRWLDRHARWIFLGGVAASAVVNTLAYQRDRAMAARLIDAPSQADLAGDLPRVTFLVPAWNEAGYVEACIRSILGLRYPNKELMLCAGGHDKTLEICRRFASESMIVLEQIPGEGKQGALQRSFEQSTGEILFLTDADCLVDDACVEATLAPLILDHKNAATGCWQPFTDEKDNPFIAYQWANHLLYQAAMPDQAETLDGRNSAVRRSALTAAGAFQNEAPTGTDYVLSQQLKAVGFGIHNVLGSRVQTEYPANFSDYMRQGSRWYRNRLVQGIKYGQVRDVAASLWAAGASLFMLAGWLALLLRWRAAGAAWLAGLAHLAFGQARLTGFFRKLGFGQDTFWSMLPRFMTFTLLSNLAMVKGLLASLNWRTRKLW